MKKRSMLELNRLSVESFKETQKTPIIVILDNIRSALNVGSAFRTSDAFLVQEIALCGITAQPPHREILKTAIGATNSVDWQYFENTQAAIQQYREQGYHIAAVEQAADSIPLQHVSPKAQAKMAIIFGNEVKGVDQAVMDEVDSCIEIPQFGTKHSFNISVSMGIVLWSLTQKIRPDLIV
ncbi:RNA methyltransferase [Aureispira anguillae]|uniref:RNA methyltransferase n=1 Tax=Aureispira anguillae TaxID=2864201 RepID=A0A916DS31_9BACT|nr:RNA methyltransferase [Aureispira anguillae]BDS12249.1 RNA methyltransferase [Aureispira anguillae]